MTTTSPTAFSAASADDLAAATVGRNGWSTAGSAGLGIPPLRLVDGPLGVVSTTMDERDTSVLFPSGTMLAATWDPPLVRAVGEALGREARSRGIDVLLGPNLGLPRNPFSGRAFEMYSEEPLLTGEMARALIRGVQSQGVAAAAKHLVGNDTETQRRTMNAQISEPTLREVYLLPFEYALKGGARVVMTAYNRLNGIPCVAHPDLLAIVRQQWGWPGVVISDWFGVTDGIASATAGVDLEMPGPPRHFGDPLAHAVAEGSLDRSRLEDMAARVHGLTTWVQQSIELAGEPTHPVEPSGILHEAAVTGTVLLTNRDHALPAPPCQVQSIAVLGPLGRTPTLQGGTFARVTPAGPVPGLVDTLTRRYADSTTVRWSPALPRTAPRPLSACLLEDPDGRGAVRLDYTAADGTTQTEHRPGSSFVWFHHIPLLGGTRDGGAVRLSARFTAPETGRYEFGASGTGELELRADDRVLAARPAPAPEDVMGVIARAEPTTATVDLEAGQTVTVQASARFIPSHVQSIGLTVRPPEAPAEQLLDDAVALARESDVVVIVVGDDENTSRESADLPTSTLPAAQQQLIAAVAAVHQRVVVIVNASRAVDMPWAEDVSAVLCSWYGGQVVSEALAAIIAGDREPEGRLPVTIAARDEDYPGWGQFLDAEGTLDYEASEPIGHRHFQHHGRTPRFALGHGLGYTDFDWHVIGMEVPDRPGDVTLSVRVTNTGPRSGSDVVQCYTRRAGETYDRLAAFERVRLDAGESQEVRIALPLRSFLRWDEQLQAWSAPADVPNIVTVGRSAAVPVFEDVLSWACASVRDARSDLDHRGADDEEDLR